MRDIVRLAERFKPFLIINFTIAVLDFSAAWFGNLGYIPESSGYVLSAWLCTAWFIVFALGIVLYKKRGLWALLGAPVALWWPSILALIFVACSIDRANCL